MPKNKFTDRHPDEMFQGEPAGKLVERLCEAAGILYMMGFLTQAERIKIHQRIREWVDLHREEELDFKPNLIDAMKRANEIMNMSTGMVPRQAFKYYSYLASKFGVCTEMCITAYAHYAQAVEGLECQDPAYKIDSAGLEWFQKNKGGDA